MNCFLKKKVGCMRFKLQPPHIISIVYTKDYLPKVSVFVWHLLCNRLPTKDNLFRRRVLHHDDTVFVGGCGCPETMGHLFFRCDFFGSLWHLIYQWIGINFTPPVSVREHLHQFGHLAGLPRFTHSFL